MSALAKSSPADASLRRSSAPPLSSPESHPIDDSNGYFTIEMSDLMLPASDLESELFDIPSSNVVPEDSNATVVSEGSSEELHESYHLPVSGRSSSRRSSSKPKRKPSAAERRQSLPSSLFLSSKGGDSNDLSTPPVPEFLCHLFSMLRDPSYSDLISWKVPTSDEPDHKGGGIQGIGKIVVHKPEALQDFVLGKYYRHSKYASFQRQLNYFGFKKRLHGGKKGKLSPCSYIHETLTDDVESLFTLKRRPPAKKRGSEEDSTVDEVLPTKLSSQSSSSKRRRLSVEKQSKKNSNTSKKNTNKKGKKKNQKKEQQQDIVYSKPVQVQAEECAPPSPTSVASIYPARRVNNRIRTALTASERVQVFQKRSMALSSEEAKIAQPTLLELLSTSLPPSDILFNDDVDSVDDQGIPAWVTDDGKYHYHNVDSSLVDLAMLY
jgi:hypothetical protein